MSPTTKRCPKCGQTKPVAEFPASRATKSGLYAYCRACSAARTADRAERIPSVRSLTDRQIFDYIDRRAIESPQTGDWHWRWTGARQTGESTREVHRRLAEMVGHELPPGAMPWCAGEVPFHCLNLDHYPSPGRLKDVAFEEVVSIDEEGTVRPNGFSISSPQDEEGRWLTQAGQLAALETDLFERGDEAADKFLHEHGFNRHGEPLRPYFRSSPKETP